MQRDLLRVVPAQTLFEDHDMRLLRSMPLEERVAVGPVVLIDHFRHSSPRAIERRPHPHAGVQVVRYLLEGGVEHRDSMGCRDWLGAGDAQCIHAGRGMLCTERPLSRRHGLQLWINLPPDEKVDEPSYCSVRAVDIPRLRADGCQLFVVAGRVNGTPGPLMLSEDAVLARLRLDPCAETVLDVDPELELGLYVLQGGIQSGTGHLSAGDLGVLGGGTRIGVAARGPGAAEVALIGGAAMRGELLFSGGLVMDTPERLAQAKRDLAHGRMGHLQGVTF